MRVLRKLTERGNTVVVVEHDPEIMREADHVIDLGPGAGARGGEVVFAGSYDELLARSARRRPARSCAGASGRRSRSEPRERGRAR